MFRTIAYVTSVAVVAASPLTYAAEPTVLILPFAQPAEAHRDLGFGIELKVMGALRAMGELNVVHPKIRDSVVRRHTRAAGLNPERRREAFARYVGANWILEGTVAETPQPRIVMRLSPANGGQPQQEEVTAATLAEAIRAIPDAMLRLVNGADSGNRSYGSVVTPRTDNPDALARLGTCYRILNDQSVGIRRPALLNDVRVAQAGNRCRAALRLAPDLVEAEAGLAMVDALEGRAEEAKARLASIKDHPSFLAYYWIAKFWVLAKFYSPEQAIEALREAIDRNPSFMLGRSYLGEALSVMGRHEAALEVYKAYLKRIPDQPYVLQRLGHELSRLKRHKAALKVTQKALDADPDNAETRLQYGSRLIDAGRFAAAIDVLSGLVNDIDARGEIHLRLGYAQLEADRLGDAEEAFRRALDKATAPQEWRTRGRAHYDLAKLHARQNKLDEAFADLANAIDAGFKAPELFRKDQDFKSMRRDERFAELLNRESPLPEIPVRYTSPFFVDADELARAAAQGGLPPGSRSTVDF